MTARTGMILAVVMSGLASTKPAAAESPQALFEEGKRLLHQGDYANACTKLAESMKLDASLGTELHLAECHARLGQTATAWREFRDAESWAEMKSDPRLKLARQRVQELAPTLSKLTLVAPSAPAGLEIRVDGTLVDKSQWGTAVPIDPRSHEITAEAPGRKRWSRSITVGPNGAAVTVTVPALETDVAVETHSVPPREDVAAVRSHVPASEHAKGSTRGNAQRVAGIVVIGAGAGGIVVGGVLAGIAKSKLDFSNTGHCRAGNLCDAMGVEARGAALDLAGASTVAMIAGGLAIAGGVVLFATAPRDKSVQVAVAPTVGGAAVTLQRDW